ncbi:MAG: methylated-DNA--[protein]-cysteine S-methyltransferase [Rhodoferax sp.]
MESRAATGYCLVDTALGACGLAWGAQRLCGAQLPEASQQATLRTLARRFPQANAVPPPAWVEAVAAQLQRALQGQPSDFSALDYEMDWAGAFQQRVWRYALAIPWGQTRSYGEVAQHLGSPGAARAVGQALGANPFAPLVPCHRVLAQGRASGGFSAPGGERTKLRLLEIEGALHGPGDLFGPSV